MSEKINLKEEKFILACNFSPQSHGYVVTGRQNFTESMWWSKAAHLMVARKQRQKVEGFGDKVHPSRAHTQ
jgi:hypothetical protein